MMGKIYHYPPYITARAARKHMVSLRLLISIDYIMRIVRLNIF
jgi:hypothetical protein